MFLKWFRAVSKADLGDLGLLPTFLDEADSRTAQDQIGGNMPGGWTPIEGFNFHPFTSALTYPGDPPLYPRWTAKFRLETILVYPHDWVLILQPGGAFSVCRCD